MARVAARAQRDGVAGERGDPAGDGGASAAGRLPGDAGVLVGPRRARGRGTKTTTSSSPRPRRRARPSTAAMVPPATAARPGVDQRQRARPRGWGRCAVVTACSSWACGLHARAPVRVQRRRSAVTGTLRSRRVAALRVAWGREQNRGGWRAAPALGWVVGARARSTGSTSWATARAARGSNDTDCARRELGHRFRRHGPPLSGRSLQHLGRAARHLPHPAHQPAQEQLDAASLRRRHRHRPRRRALQLASRWR